MRVPARRGFSLLEVVVAMAILALSLMAIFSLNSGAVRNHVYTKKLTVASLLARSKMIDIEQELYDEGLPNDDDEDSGDFSDEGWPGFKWRAKILAPRTQGLSPEQLMGALFNFPLGGEEGGDLGGLAALFGGGADPKAGGGADPMGALAALGPMAGMAQAQFGQMVEQIAQSVREVHLTVTWKEGKQTESIDLVTHVVSLGPGSDRNGDAAVVAGTAVAPPGAIDPNLAGQLGAPGTTPNIPAFGNPLGKGVSPFGPVLGGSPPAFRERPVRIGQ